ncbi:MAG: T9SS type A sorting domain-containing protein [Saprospiraceae bacterium]|nr:MAG: Esterase/lipase-like protein [Bacteroidetes bacterium OLB9]MCO6463638.1 T9SS type A sorting domain-containing protein [Saprospiraceae bacterium]
MRITFVFILAFWSLWVIAQESPIGCDGKRYIEYVFSDYTVTSVKYARPIPENFDLYMDVYQPKGDVVERRPLILFVHGGGFLSGSKADMSGFCIDFVKRGFVTASIDYRLIFGIPDKAGFIRGVVKAMNDFKASYRFFKSDAAGPNIFRIDTTKMMVGGYSAGAVTVLHSAYLDRGDPIPDFILDEINAQGGFKGNTGDAENLSHDEQDILGVFNFAGATFTPDLFDEGDPFLMSYHGDADTSVPIDSANFFDITTAYGSRVLHTWAALKGIPQALEVVPGGGHTEIFTDPNLFPYLVEYIFKAINVYYPRICETGVGTTDAAPEVITTVYPNPASDYVKVSFGQHVERLLIYDVTGQMIQSIQVHGREVELDSQKFNAGMYFIVPVAAGKTGRPAKVVFK